MGMWTRTFSMLFPKDDRNLGVKCIRAKVPQQTNFSDCGLFMLHYVEIFLKAFESLSSKIQVSRDWFNPEEVMTKRSMIQRLIRKMQEEELQRKVSIKHVDLPCEELTNGSMPMQDASVALNVNVSPNNVIESLDKSYQKAHSPPRYAMLPDRSNHQKKAVSVLDNSFKQAPALSSSSYSKNLPAPHLQSDAGSQILSNNSVRGLSSGSTMEVVHPIQICADPGGGEPCYNLMSSEATNDVHKEHCSVCSPPNALQSRTTGLGKGHASDIKPESHFRLHHLYISSDEETGFVKVQKIVEALKMHSIVRLQNRQIAALSSKSASTGNATEGMKDQQPHIRWRLQRKSQMFLP
ncbi:hypothetical protein GOP47_0008842 [Adiantum capillus-veneris]|uniref:Ubiquitin-like protease family profile domain-containing protein n=1 Tax=Adiantum capillus-veneris TaxID=13818 RepID=A0A9D4ZK37_ADICA|nr:hypothetical protein GOP47_0008842 [Adiantum capillus-veneris]